MASQPSELQMPPLPDPRTVQIAGEISVQDRDGLAYRFCDLYSSPGQHLIIFIRHFFCGNCEDYIRALRDQLPPSLLEKHSPLPIFIKIVGCGAPSLIAGYATRTDCPYPIYTNQDRKLYKHLGMEESLTLGDKKPDYTQNGLAMTSGKALVNIIKSGKDGLSGGNFSQNGGEWLFRTDEDGNVGSLKWMHRMSSTRDHTEVLDLKNRLGIDH